MKQTAIGFGIGILLILGLYFFVYVPDTKEAYKRGLSQCEEDTDTLYLPGKPKIEYRDTSFAKKTPVDVDKKDSVNVTLFSSVDTGFVSGKDTISIRVTNSQELNLTELIESEQGRIRGNLADWFIKIEHKDYVPTADTVKIFTPKYVTRTEQETNWLITGVAYVAGIVSAIIIFFIK